MKCVDAPTPELPAYLECPACDGYGCQDCDGGKIRIDGCPHKRVRGDTWQAVAAATLLEHGILPVAGGLMDQTQSYYEAAIFIRGEIETYKAERIKAIKHG